MLGGISRYLETWNTLASAGTGKVSLHLKPVGGYLACSSAVGRDNNNNNNNNNTTNRISLTLYPLGGVHVTVMVRLWPDFTVPLLGSRLKPSCCRDATFPVLDP
ncbi:hypothetical protein EYF80_040861 [Liparis tanakae]|uniref:Uncharacterized protein n=1 Tax=Liparis tanakae TaxID=230148 RepID=A0A4Z2G5S0_9TELE|nr:hypothetical protein EYF80_040861 [Liparis tanakae]